MACGTPVVGFDTGGIAEYVLPDETGLLAKLGDVEQLSHQIARLVDEPELRLQMGRNARRMMDDEFEVAAQTGKYLDVYRELIDQPALQAAG